MSQKEAKLQSQMVMSHSQKRPEENRLLWATLNRTLSERDGQKQKAMGLKRGVADLMYFRNGRLVGIEVKFPGEKHHADHVANQLNWGKNIINEGGEYFIVTTIESFWAVIKNEIDCVPGLYHVNDVEKLLNLGKKTVIF